MYQAHATLKLTSSAEELFAGFRVSLDRLQGCAADKPAEWAEEGPIHSEETGKLLLDSIERVNVLGFNQ